MSNVPERIMGTEVEYAIHWVGKKDSSSTSQELFLASIPPGTLSIGEFLSNGARLYRDVGNHPEYATPECAGPLQATQYEIAGEQTVSALAQCMAARSGRLAVANKRLCDPRGNQWGSHHSFEVSRKLFSEVAQKTADPTYVQGLLVSHLATNSIFAGSGMYLNSGGYRISQKKWRTTSAITSDTTREKGLINTRDESHSGGFSDKSARLHVQAGEATISPWATWMQLGTFSILLRVLENGWKVDVPLLENAGQAASVVAQDPSLSQVLKLRDGSGLTAVDIQAEYAALGQKAKDAGMLSEQEEKVADSWSSVTEDLPRRDYVDCTDRIDWLCRQNFVELHAAKRLKDKQKLVQHKQEVDLVYDRLGPQGIGYKLRARGQYAMRFSDGEIAELVQRPPNTRARTRGEIIKYVAQRDFYQQDRRAFEINWDFVTIRGSRRRLGRARRYDPNLVALVCSQVDEMCSQ